MVMESRKNGFFSGLLRAAVSVLRIVDVFEPSESRRVKAVCRYWAIV